MLNGCQNMNIGTLTVVTGYTGHNVLGVVILTNHQLSSHVQVYWTMSGA